MRLENLKGQRFGRYEVVELIGRGGMAAVYRAHDTALRRDVALKVLYPHYGGDATLLERFQREAILAARLDHPQIVPIYDVGEQDGMAYIAMRLLNGRSLADLLQQRQTIPPAELIPWVEQIAAALDYAHARGVVHRDIKPANIMLEGEASPRALLTDFGIAKSGDTPSLTSTGALIGTPDYMAPEQIRGDRAIDGRADIYALGVLAFRCLTGRRPFEGSTQEVLIGHLEGRFSSPSALNPALPEAIDPVIRRAMASRPDQRHATAGEFASALAEALLRGRVSQAPTLVAQARPRPAAAPSPATSARPTAAPPRPARWRGWALLAGVAALGAVLAIGLLIGRLSATDRTATPTAPAALQPSAAPSDPTAPPAAPTATPETPPAATAAQPTPRPSEVIAPQPTATPAPPSPTARPTQPQPTASPASPTAPPSPTPTDTSTPTLTPSPTVTLTPCPIGAVGGFGALLRSSAPISARVGCATGAEQGGVGSLVEQPFERGAMFFFVPTNEIYVLIGGAKGVWYRFEPRDDVSRPTPTPAEPPAPGLFIPVRGFGAVWGDNEEIRIQIGYGTSPEAGPLEGARQLFTGGTLLYSRTGVGNGPTIYVMYSDGTFERYADPNQ